MFFRVFLWLDRVHLMPWNVSQRRRPVRNGCDQEPVFRFSRPIVRIGQDFSLGEGETVREIQSGLADITVAGHVEDNVAVIVGSLRLASTARIDDSVVVVGGTLTIDPGATVQHDLIVIGGNLTRPPISPPVVSRLSSAASASPTRCMRWCRGSHRAFCSGVRWCPTIRWVWIAVAIFLFVYLMVGALFATPVRAVADTVAARPVSSFLLGLLVLVLTAPVIAILAATVIGIAIVPFVLCALVVGGLIGKAGVIRATGRSVLPEDDDAGRIRGFGSILIGFAVPHDRLHDPGARLHHVGAHRRHRPRRRDRGISFGAPPGASGTRSCTAAHRACRRQRHE